MPLERRGRIPVYVTRKKLAEREALQHTQISFDDFLLNYAEKKLSPEQIPGQIRYEGFLGNKAAAMAERYAADHGKISITETVRRGVSALNTVVDIQAREEFVVVSNLEGKERVFDLPQVEAIDPAESTNVVLSINISPSVAQFLYNYSRQRSVPVNDIINMSVLVLDDIARGEEFYAAAKLRTMRFNF